MKILNYILLSTSIMILAAIASLIATTNGSIWPLAFICVPLVIGVISALINLEFLEV